MTGSDALIDQHFRVRECQHERNLAGKWYAARHGNPVRFLFADGTVREALPDRESNSDALFEDYADVVEAYELWLKREGER